MASVITFEDVLREWRDDSDVITARSSGSTGTPKTIYLKKDFVRASASRTNTFFLISPESRLHSCVGPQFIGGKMMAVRSELAGCSFTWEIPSNRPLAALGKGEKIDLLAIVPSQMLHLLDNIDSLPEIGAIIIGGSAIHPVMRERIIKSGLNVFETYGMTETASHIALQKIESGSHRFRPLPGIRVSLDERGCLVIDFEDFPSRFVTNDMADIYEEGSFRILGRYDRMIITGGRKVNPEELEKRIAPLISGAFLITSRPDEKWGERIVLLIEGERTDESELRRKMKEILVGFEVPKDIEWVNMLERTENGKIRVKQHM